MESSSNNLTIQGGIASLETYEVVIMSEARRTELQEEIAELLDDIKTLLTTANETLATIATNTETE